MQSSSDGGVHAKEEHPWLRPRQSDASVALDGPVGGRLVTAVEQNNAFQCNVEAELKQLGLHADEDDDLGGSIDDADANVGGGDDVPEDELTGPAFNVHTGGSSIESPELIITGHAAPVCNKPALSICQTPVTASHAALSAPATADGWEALSIGDNMSTGAISPAGATRTSKQPPLTAGTRLGAGDAIVDGDVCERPVTQAWAGSDVDGHNTTTAAAAGSVTHKVMGALHRLSSLGRGTSVQPVSAAEQSQCVQ